MDRYAARYENLVHNSVMQGITTALLNPDGGGMWPVADHIARYQKDGVGLNVFMTVGHNKIRELAMGMAQRTATPQEIDRMKQLLTQASSSGRLPRCTARTRWMRQSGSRWRAMPAGRAVAAIEA